MAWHECRVERIDGDMRCNSLASSHDNDIHICPSSQRGARSSQSSSEKRGRADNRSQFILRSLSRPLNGCSSSSSSGSKIQSAPTASTLHWHLSSCWDITDAIRMQCGNMVHQLQQQPAQVVWPFPLPPLRSLYRPRD